MRSRTLQGIHMWLKHSKYQFTYSLLCHGRKSCLGNGILIDTVYLCIVFGIALHPRLHHYYFYFKYYSLYASNQLTKFYFLVGKILGRLVNFHIPYHVSSNLPDIECVYQTLYHKSYCEMNSSVFHWSILLHSSYFCPIFAAILSNC